MKVKEVMTELVRTCGADSNLAAAAMSMWDGDCGILPVVDRSRESGPELDQAPPPFRGSGKARGVSERNPPRVARARRSFARTTPPSA
jgi:hypothetical protein